MIRQDSHERSCSTLAAAPSVCHSEQFVLFDVTFTYHQGGCRQLHAQQVALLRQGRHAQPEAAARDWTAPVDYRNRTVHIRTEVMAKPAGGEPTTWTLCYIPNKGQGNGYGCTGHRPLPRVRASTSRTSR